MTPIAGLSVASGLDCCDLYALLLALDVEPRVFLGDVDRFRPLRDRVVFIVSDDPEVVLNATAAGFDGVIWTAPGNEAFPWHLRALDLDDARAGLARLRRIWEAKRCPA